MRCTTLHSRFLVRAVAPIAVALLAVPVGAQRDAYDTDVTAQHVAGPVHMLTGAGGNIGVSAGNDGILLVDRGFAPRAEQARAALKAIAPGDPKFIVNTHFHRGGGNAIFGKEARIVAHTNVRDRMTGKRKPGKRRVEAVVSHLKHADRYYLDYEFVDRGYISSGSGGQWIYQPVVVPRLRKRRPARVSTGTRSQDAMPAMTFNEGMSIHFNGEEIVIGHLTAGHTDGDSFVFFTGSNVVHVGYQFQPGRFPYIDIAYGGNAVGLRDSIGWMLEYFPADAKVIPSSGPLSSVDDLKTYHRMLTECVAVVKAAKDAGKRLKKIRAAGLPDEWSGRAFPGISESVFIGFIYDSL